MDSTFSFEQFVASQTPHIGLAEFTANLLITMVLALALSWVYVRYGKALSNRRIFARNLVVIAMTTMLIITIVKSSLALSLGLVGALSIVRFRTPIKEPEELAFLFLSIAIGLGLGAGQRAVVVIGFVLIVAVIWVRARHRPDAREQGLHLSLSTARNGAGELPAIVEILERDADSVALQRVDESPEGLQADFIVTLSDLDALERLRSSLRERDEGLSVSVLDNRLW